MVKDILVLASSQPRGWEVTPSMVMASARSAVSDKSAAVSNSRPSAEEVMLPIPAMLANCAITSSSCSRVIKPLSAIICIRRFSVF